MSQSLNVVPCKICGNPSNGFHYSVISCEACKGFFRRCVQNRRRVICKTGLNSCGVWKANGIRCASCRFQICLEKGMLPSFVQVNHSDESVEKPPLKRRSIARLASPTLVLKPHDEHAPIAQELSPKLPDIYDSLHSQYCISMESLWGIMEFTKRNNVMFTMNVFANFHRKSKLSQAAPVSLALPAASSLMQLSPLAHSIVENINVARADFEPDPSLLSDFTRNNITKFFGLVYNNAIIDIGKTIGFRDLDEADKKLILSKKSDFIVTVQYAQTLSCCMNYRDLLDQKYIQQLIIHNSKISLDTFIERFCPEMKQNKDLAVSTTNPFRDLPSKNGSYKTYQSFIDLVEFFRLHEIDAIESALLQMSFLLLTENMSSLSETVRVTLMASRARILQVAQEYCRQRTDMINQQEENNSRFITLFFKLPFLLDCELAVKHYTYYVMNSPTCSPVRVFSDIYESRKCFVPVLSKDLKNNCYGDLVNPEFIDTVNHLALANDSEHSVRE